VAAPGSVRRVKRIGPGAVIVRSTSACNCGIARAASGAGNKKAILDLRSGQSCFRARVASQFHGVAVLSLTTNVPSGARFAKVSTAAAVSSTGKSPRRGIRGRLPARFRCRPTTHAQAVDVHWMGVDQQPVRRRFLAPPGRTSKNSRSGLRQSQVRAHAATKLAQMAGMNEIARRLHDRIVASMMAGEDRDFGLFSAGADNCQRIPRIVSADRFFFDDCRNAAAHNDRKRRVSRWGDIRARDNHAVRAWVLSRRVFGVGEKRKSRGFARGKTSALWRGIGDAGRLRTPGSSLRIARCLRPDQGRRPMTAMRVAGINLERGRWSAPPSTRDRGSPGCGVHARCTGNSAISADVPSGWPMRRNPSFSIRLLARRGPA